MKKVDANTRRLVREALREDLGRGDITTEALFKGHRDVEGVLLAKEEIVLSGTKVFEEVFAQFRQKFRLKWLFRDGDLVPKGTIFCRFEGSLKAILKGERVALNFLQRLSGVATLTRRFVRRLSSPKIKIIDTRKTTPLLRMLEKKAVSHGGGGNHRFGLYDMYMIKDNHIQGCGSLKEALDKIKAKRGNYKIEAEAKSLKEVKEALKGGADIIMLDNMSLRQIKKSIAIIGKRAKIELSGGINLSNIRKYSGLSVDYISIGALTHSFKSVDISLEIE